MLKQLTLNQIAYHYDGVLVGDKKRKDVPAKLRQLGLVYEGTEFGATGLVSDIKQYREELEGEGHDTLRDTAETSLDGLKHLNPLTVDFLVEKVTGLLGATTSLSPMEKLIVRSAIAEGIIDLETVEIPFNETRCYLLSLRYDADVNYGIPSTLIKYLKDFLVVGSILTDGKAKLTKDIKFKSLPNSKRRLLLRDLNNFLPELPLTAAVKAGEYNWALSQMVEYLQYWKQWLYGLHPHDQKKYGGHFSKVKQFAVCVYNAEAWGQPKTYNSYIEDAFKNKHLDKLFYLIGKRVNYALRIFDRILRVFKERSFPKFSHLFNTNLDKLSMKVIIELITKYKGALRGDKRSVSTTGRSSYNLKDKELIGIEEELIEFLENVCVAKIETYGLPELGEVSLGDDLTMGVIPSHKSTGAFSTLDLSRGSWYDVSEIRDGKVRSYVHWSGASKSSGRSVDIDICVMFYDKNANYVEKIDYTNYPLRYADFSGDITNWTKPASEYIDIDVDMMLKNDIRYFVMTMQNYRGTSILDVDGNYGLVTDFKKGRTKTWLPNNVLIGNQITSDTKGVVCCLVDVEEAKMLHIDTDHNESTMRNLDITDLVKEPLFSLHDLVMLHLRARNGMIVQGSTNVVNTQVVVDNIGDWMLT